MGPPELRNSLRDNNRAEYNRLQPVDLILKILFALDLCSKENIEKVIGKTKINLQYKFFAIALVVDYYIYYI